jgi:hypothetical protein
MSLLKPGAGDVLRSQKVVKRVGVGKERERELDRLRNEIFKPVELLYPLHNGQHHGVLRYPLLAFGWPYSVSVLAGRGNELLKAIMDDLKRQLIQTQKFLYRIRVELETAKEWCFLAVT